MAKRRDAELSAVSRALDAGDDASALEALLVAWRATRAPRLAELIDLVSERIAAALPAPADREWKRIAKQQHATDLPRLVAALPDSRRHSLTRATQIATLAKWPEDPRLATAMLQELGRGPVVGSSTQTTKHIGVIFLVRVGDVRVLPKLQALGERATSLASVYRLPKISRFLQSAFAEACEALREVTPREVDTTVCDRIATQLTAATAAADTLMREILANPDDDGPRQVLADQLLERGDPRGEFIALQLSGADPARAEALRATHYKQWLGALAAVGTCDRFERGFPADFTITAGPEQVRNTAGDPLWATIESLMLDLMELPTELLQHPVMRVKRIAGLQSYHFEELLAWKPIPPYESIGAVCRAETLAVMLGAKRNLRALRHYRFMGTVDDTRALWTSWLEKQLDEVSIERGMLDLAGWLRELARARHLPQVRLEHSRRHDAAVISRDRAGKLTVCDLYSTPGDGTYKKFVPQLAKVPKRTLSSVRVHGHRPGKKLVAAFEAAAKRAGCALALPPAVTAPGSRGSAGSRRRSSP
jgi:uncharacterized protein (TIGR02996 family)